MIFQTVSPRAPVKKYRSGRYENGRMEINMSILLQLGLGLLPLCFALVVIMIMRRCFTLKMILGSLFTITLSCLFIVSSFTPKAENAQKGDMSKDDMLYIAYALVETESWESANEIIDEYCSTFGYDSDCALLCARIAAVKGDGETAAAIYERLLENKDIANRDAIRQEYALAKAAYASKGRDTAMLDYIELVGRKPEDYGITDTGSATATNDEAVREMQEAAKKAVTEQRKKLEPDDPAIRDIPKYIADTDTVYDKFVQEGNVDVVMNPDELLTDDFTKPGQDVDEGADTDEDSETVNGPYITDPDGEDTSDSNYAPFIPGSSDNNDGQDKVTEDSRDEYHAGEEEELLPMSVYEYAKQLAQKILKLMEDNPSYRKLPALRRSLLKLYVLIRDYPAIAAFLDMDATAEELMVSAMLYINGYITQKDFEGYFCGNDKGDIEIVIKQLKSMPSAKNDPQVKKNIAALESSAGKDSLGMIESGLIFHLENTPGVDKSKIQLILSYIYFYRNNKDLADEHLSDAIDSSSESEDEKYSVPMMYIEGIINGSGDAEDIKHLQEYIDQAMNNSLPVKTDPEVFVSSDTKDGDDTDYTGDTDNKDDGFGGYFKDKVNAYSTAINIGIVDTEDFPDISARLQISSDYPEIPKDPMKYLEISDSRRNIGDFRIRKLEFKEANILLLCDNSGSMSGSYIEGLKKAVKDFIDESDSSENISVVSFDSGIINESGFVSDHSDLYGMVDAMYAGGGTNIYGSIMYCIEKFPKDSSANNIMIVMTDGDESSPGDEFINVQLKNAAAERGITIYTLGLNENVGAAYLAALATAGGGDFVYASNTSELEDLYARIHTQSKGQYVLEYTALDTISATDRELYITIKENNIKAMRTYSLDINGNVTETIAPQDRLEINQGSGVYGLDATILYRSGKNEKIDLHGEGFEKGSKITAELSGEFEYDLKTEYVDAETLSVTIPANAVVDVYDLRVTVDDVTTVLEDELYIVNGTKQELSFGKYTFSAYNIESTGYNTTRLSGLVDLCGWLRFNGDVIIEGDLGGSAITIRENDGAYILFDPDGAIGVAKTMARDGKPLSVSSLDGIVLYRHDENVDPDTYRVSSIGNTEISFLDTYSISDADVSIYPHKFLITDGNFLGELPFGDHIVGGSYSEELYTVNLDSAFTVTENGIFGRIEQNTSGYQRPVTFCTQKAQMKRTGYVWDSLDCTTEISFDTLMDIFGQNNISVTVGWKDGYFDSMKMKSNGDIVKKIDDIPVTISGFSGEINGLSGEKLRDSLEFEKCVIPLETKLTFAKFSEYFENGKEYFGDISLFKTDKFELCFSLGNGNFKGNTEMTFLEKTKLVNATVEIGKENNYTDAKLGLTENTSGDIRVELGATDVKYKNNDGIDIDVFGKSGKLELNKSFMGIRLKADGDIEVGRWFVDKEVTDSYETMIGVYRDRYGRTQFIIGAHSNIVGENDEFSAYACTSDLNMRGM